MQIGEVSLLTNDVPRLANFYRELLGVACAGGPGGDEGDETHQFILTEGTTLTVYNDGTEKNNNNQNMCLAFTVQDVDAEFERLKAMGARIVEPPQTRPWGARNMHFCDPDGNHIYLRSFPAE